MLHGVVLAAGKGTRMNSPLPKVMHPVLGKPMILRVAETAAQAGCGQVTAVVGYGREQVIPLLEKTGCGWVVQEPQLGTAHALRCAMPVTGDATEVLVLLGDVPLIRAETLASLISARRTTGSALTVLTAFPPDPSGYGRVLRAPDGSVARIVEHRDAGPDERACGEINTGIMVFDGGSLSSLLEGIGNENAQGEYYLTDAVETALQMGLGAGALSARDWLEVRGVNDPVHLARCTGVMRRRVNEKLLLSGVVIPDPEGVWIEDTAVVEPGALVGRHCRISGSSFIASTAELGDFCVVENARVDCRLPEGSVRSGG